MLIAMRKEHLAGVLLTSYQKSCEIAKHVEERKP